ncbi:hypothetical protein PoB_007414400 [Plakobranchus ocellatus]|uniref:Uncharacterized protein n=1 Tax=Plakobranchus ocellatus TaxID=259542 RepID=A0AAV4DUD9_9GAST|nr:hypothetical protein PoB_007414400 [Plakobranchus ocellatus]
MECSKIASKVTIDFALRSAGTILSRVRALPSAPRPDGGPLKPEITWLYTKTYHLTIIPTTTTTKTKPHHNTLPSPLPPHHHLNRLPPSTITKATKINVSIIIITTATTSTSLSPSSLSIRSASSTLSSQ